MWELPGLNILSKSVLAVLASMLFSVWIKSKKKHPALSKIPGPRPLPIIGNLIEFCYDGLQIVSTFRRLADKYGGICRMEIGTSRNSSLVMLSKPEYLETYYTSKMNINRSSQYDPIGEVIGNSLFLAKGNRWRKMRELTMQAFFHKPVHPHLPSIMSSADALIEDLRQKADGNVFPALRPLQEAFIHSTYMNIMGETIDPEMTSVMRNVTDFVMKIAYQRNFYIQYFSDIFFPLIPTGKKFYTDIDHINKVVKNIIAKKKADLKELRCQGETIPDNYIYNMIETHLTDDELADEFKFLFVAGSDTTTNTLGFTLTCLGLHPEIQQKVFEEDQEVQQRLGRLPSTVDDLKGYKYLESVIKETLRMFPVGPMIARSLSQDTYFGKYLVPEGTNVAALQIHTFLDPALFPNPMIFDPDRFSPGNIDKIPAYAYNPFGAGPRGCPGIRYAYISLKIVISAIVRNFIVHSAYSSIEQAHQNADAEMTFKDQKNYPIRLTSRN